MATGLSEDLVCLSGGTVLTFDEDYSIFEDGEVWFQGNEIVAVGNRECYPTRGENRVQKIDVTGRLVIPGFINAHSHSYSAILKGSVEKEPLDIYMLHVIAAGDAMTPRETYISAQLDAVSMLRRGMTSVIDHYSERPVLSAEGLEAVCNGFEDIGIRATVAPMFSDLPYIETIPLDKDELPRKVQQWYGNRGKLDPAEYFKVIEPAIVSRSSPENRVNVILGVDGPQRCSSRLVEMTAEFQQQHNAAIQTHMLETKTQAAMKPEQGFVRRMVDLGILNDRSSLVHFIWTDRKDMDAALEAGVTVVHCPQSNAMLGAGISPVMQLRQMGIPVAFGTDGSNCGPASYLENLRLAAWFMRLTETDFERWPDSRVLLQEAYRAGARAIGLPQKVGRLEAGARADIVVLDPSGHWHMPMGDLYRHILHYESGESVESVWVDGQPVVRDRKLTTIEEDALVAEAREIAVRRKKDMPPESLALIEAQYPAFRNMVKTQLETSSGIDRRITLS